MDSVKYFCPNCKKELRKDQGTCPYCGNIKKEICLEVQDEIKIRECMRGRQKRKGFKKFMAELLQGWFPSKNKEEFPDGVQKTRLIDKKDGRYQEKVINEKTGEVQVNKEEKLSEHK